ncbi:MAG: aldo/keto reductase [Candidatus Binataceae bacterium]
MKSRGNWLLGRRDFLKRTALAGVGLGLMRWGGSASAAVAAAQPPHVKRYVALGKTGIKMSDISFGSDSLHLGQEDLVRFALDRGINYFDSAEVYTGGDAETTIGNALKGSRDKVYLTSKVLCGRGERKERMMTALESSLKRLRTDYVDIYFNHAVNDVERVRNPEWHEFVANSKKQGKIRFSGMSGHSGHLVHCVNHAIDSGQFDVLLCAHNFGQDPTFAQRFTRSFDFVAIQPRELPDALKRAREKGVGVVVMKTLRGARLNDMRPYETGGASFSQAAFRWVLSGPYADALIISMRNENQISEYLGASGATSTAAADFPLLVQYARMNDSTYCRPACNICESSCPVGVPIADVMRTRMYARDYGDVRHAREEYALLGSGAAACLSCTARACAGACPYGIQTERLAEATHLALAGDGAAVGWAGS